MRKECDFRGHHHGNGWPHVYNQERPHEGLEVCAARQELCPPTRRRTAFAASMPWYCASSKMEMPLRSEFANITLPLLFFHRERSSEKIDPTAGRTMAWPMRIMSSRETQLRM